MLSVAVCLLLGLVLLASAILKLVDRSGTQAALATYGIRRGAPVVWAAIVGAELVLAVGVGAGIAAAAYAAAALMTLFAVAQGVALARGRGGAPCACFGARSTVSWAAVGRNAILAVAFAALPLLPEGDLSTDEWLALGLGLALLVCAGLAVAVLALAREVGMLRLRLGPEAALEIPEEGPALGSRSAAISRFEPAPGARLALALFTSAGCHVCRALEPTIATLASEPSLAVRTFEEAAEPGVWTELGIPGSPFAVAFDLEGLVLAKGTFNNLAQLESVLAAAERRRAERDLAGAVGV